MTFFQTIVAKLAKKLGLDFVEKPPTELGDYKETVDISMTAAISNRVATLTMMDSTIAIKGTSRRAEYLNQLWEDVIIDKLDAAAEVALGTGDCLLKPFTDGSRVGVDIIENGNFYICESCGDFIKSIIIKCEEITKSDGNNYERYEVHRLRAVAVDENNPDSDYVSALFIYQFAFKNGAMVDLSILPEWSNIAPEMYIPNCGEMLFGRIKCPTLNRMKLNSILGVPITYGLGKPIKKAVEAYDRFNDEFERKEAYIFASKPLFERERVRIGGKDATVTRQPVLPKGKDRIFMLLNQSSTDDLIHEYSPDIRDEAFTSAIEQNFKMVEMLAGLSAGVLTNPTTNYATATEIRANLSLTFAFMTKFRRSIEKGLRNLISSIDTLCNVNNITSWGEYTLVIDWSSAYIENLTEQYERLIQAHDKGAVSTEEVRAWVMDEPLETATEAVAKIKAADSQSDSSIQNNSPNSILPNS